MIKQSQPTLAFIEAIVRPRSYFRQIDERRIIFGTSHTSPIDRDVAYLLQLLILIDRHQVLLIRTSQDVLKTVVFCWLFLVTCGPCRLVLDRDDAQCLLDHTAKTSVAWVTVKIAMSARIVSGIPAPPIAIQCSEETARELLEIAEVHCQRAVQKIEQALTPSS